MIKDSLFERRHVADFSTFLSPPFLKKESTDELPPDSLFKDGLPLEFLFLKTVGPQTLSKLSQLSKGTNLCVKAFNYAHYIHFTQSIPPIYLPP